MEIKLDFIVGTGPDHAILVGADKKIKSSLSHIQKEIESAEAWLKQGFAFYNI